jgi:hypothetical protein
MNVGMVAAWVALYATKVFSVFSVGGGNSQITAVFLILKVTNFWSVPKISILQYPKSTM